MAESFETYSSSHLNDPNKILFNNALIDRLSGEAENNFAVDYPCILKRVAPAVTSGDQTVELSDDVLSIRRVTWKGYKLDPLPQRNFREVFQNATQQGRPFWYIFNNVGQNLIQLFPAANETIAAATANLYGSAIPDQLIIEYFQAPTSTATIPAYFRRRLLKSYVLRGCFNIEGQGQNLKASNYFKERWRILKEMYGMLLFDLHNKPRKLVVNGISSSYYFPGNPMLPIDRFGTSVDVGE